MSEEKRKNARLSRKLADEPTGEADTKPPAAETHYSVSEVAECLHWSDNSIRAMFKDEPGVKLRTVRGRTSMRIPKSAVDRVTRRMANPGVAA